MTRLCFPCPYNIKMKKSFNLSKKILLSAYYVPRIVLDITITNVIDLDSSLGSQASSYFHDFALAWNVLPMACFSLSFSFQHKRHLLREASWATQSLPISLACFNNLCNKFLISYVVGSLLIFLLDCKRHESRGLRVPYSLLFSQSLWCCLTLVGGCYVPVKWMSELSGRTRPRT